MVLYEAMGLVHVKKALLKRLDSPQMLSQQGTISMLEN